MTGMAREPHITFIDMPHDLQGKYQYFTEATMSKLTDLGYQQPFHSLEDGVHDYVQNYLMQEDKYC
jgi:ADP-L-glycero-D-manno-heptose 6-epimerase